MRKGEREKGEEREWDRVGGIRDIFCLLLFCEESEEEFYCFCTSLSLLLISVTELQ